MQMWLKSHSEFIYGVTRVVIAMMYWMHGTQKLFAWPVAGPRGGTVPLLSLIGAAGLIETVGGFMMMIGVRASWAAFICSGEMAFAYVLRQFPVAVLPIIQPPGILGESAVFNCFFFLYVASRGPGPISVDYVLSKIIGKRRASKREPSIR